MSTQAKRILAVLMAMEVVFLAATFRTWGPVLACGALAAFFVLHRGRRIRSEATSSRFPRWLRWSLTSVFYFLVVLFVAIWRMPKEFDEAINPILLGSEILAHSCMFSALSVWAFRPNRGHMAMLPLGLVVVLLCVAAGGASRSSAAQATVGLATCLGFAIASQIIMGTARGTGGEIFSHRTGNATGRSDFRMRWVGLLVSGLTISVLMMGTSVVASSLNYFLPGIQKALHEQLRDTLDAVNDQLTIGGTRYVRGSKLGSVRRHMTADPNATALRVISDVTPGYMRGHAFDAYRSRRWLSAGGIRHTESDALGMIQDRILESTGPGTNKLRHRNTRPLSHFPLSPAIDEKQIKIEISTIPMNGPMVFIPLNTRWIEARGGSIVVTRHHTIRTGLDPNLPYIAGVGLRSIPEPIEDAHRAILMDIPDFADAALRKVADEVVLPGASPRENAEAIASFFQGNFSYSLARTAIPKGTDPLVHFLETRHPAHCEYFATATALTLRAAGIPSRYVTGYVVDELSRDEDYWLARNRDAHAWVEAYDDRSKTWFPVESTPGRTYLSFTEEQQVEEAEGFFDLFSSDGPDQADSIVGRTLGWILSMRATDPLLLLFRLIQLPLFCVLVFVLWTKYLRPARDGVNAIDQQSLKMLRKADRLARRCSLVRRSSETLYQFADRIESELNEKPDLVDLAGWYRQYADARYQGQLPLAMTA